MKRITIIALFIAISASINFSTVSAQVCGNCNNDPIGAIDIADLTCYIAYLFLGAPPPAGNLEVDDYEGVTARDWIILHDHLWTDFGPLTCPPANPKYVPMLDSSYIVSFNSSIPSGSSAATIPIYLESPVDLSGIQLPLRFRLDGSIPTIDSVHLTEDLNTFVKSSWIIQETGEFVINLFPASYLGLPDNGSGPDLLANVFLSFPASDIDRSLTADLTILSPVQAPQPDSTVIAGLYSGASAGAIGYEPILKSFICGDVDGSGGQPDIADLTFLIDHLFISFPPLATPLSGNIDGVGNIDIADLTALIDHLFINFPQLGC